LLPLLRHKPEVIRTQFKPFATLTTVLRFATIVLNTSTSRVKPSLIVFPNALANMSLLLHKQPVLLITGRKAQSILPPVRATAIPNSGLDILANSQRMSLLDHADQELASAWLPRCSCRGYMMQNCGFTLLIVELRRPVLIKIFRRGASQVLGGVYGVACCRVPSAFSETYRCVLDVARL
jgi:hypothetical protein